MDARESLKPWIPRLRRYARAFLNGSPGASETVDDLVHAVLLRASEKKLAVSAANGLPLFILLTQLCRETLHQRAARHFAASTEVNLQPWGAAAPDKPHGLPHRHDSLGPALNAMKPEEKEVLLLVVLEGFSYAEVARILRISRMVLMTRLAKARHALGESGFTPAPTRPPRPSYLRVVK
ncbi:RNA polymerase sigma factor [Beijerinckia indica]|uniref:RNA polymerase, sigma-24 subunit, ECF subfamily n=1 Tax=Beijerinckia indica subsp. indica (strain ATCC 9039 / DSM 1715 / NCIMB 8712) TaxID=395963 RepID=B2IIQ3_BEII9|nr:RNA polymerase sigma factor [Beijerinckia indica]ACB94746.1 RNA polymerase, sigma-24 subunit, ECF subfamily [Beijerinckia indica subsp. indica ATCC 9039]